MTSQKIDLCARAYLEYYRSQFAKYGWAHDYAENLIETDASAALSFVVEVLNMCINEEEIAYVASGILEDLLSLHIKELQYEVQFLINEEEKLYFAIKYVWAKDNTPLQSFLSLIAERGTHKDSGLESTQAEGYKQ